CEDRTASQAMLTELVRKASRVRAGVDDKYDEHRQRPLAEHLKDFENHLHDEGNTAEYVALSMSRIRRLVDGCRFRRIGDIEGVAVQRFLASMKRDKNTSVQTCNYYLQAIKQFCRWMMLER